MAVGDSEGPECEQQEGANPVWVSQGCDLGKELPLPAQVLVAAGSPEKKAVAAAMAGQPLPGQQGPLQAGNPLWD